MFLTIWDKWAQTIDKFIIALRFFSVRSVVKLFYLVKFQDNYNWYL